MKSFKKHLDLLIHQQNKSALKKATAIFPFIHTKKISTRILFLGYWLIKRGIKEVEYSISVNDSSGKKVIEELGVINQAKAYEFSLQSLIEDDESRHEGSIEIVFESKENLVFPFPALVVNYFGPNFSTFVHTAQRRFINMEDEKQSAQKTWQGGVNFQLTSTQTPFVWLVNGPKRINAGCLDIDFHYLDGSKNYCSMILNMQPMETKRLTFPFFKEKLATIKLLLPVEKIFPRVIAGHFSQTQESLSVTHSYQDVAKQNEFWEIPTGFHGSSLMVPIFPKEQTTKIYFYPLYVDMPFNIQVDTFDQNGKKLNSKQLGEIDGKTFQEFDLTSMAKSKELVFAKVIAIKKKQLPARIKIALDILPKKGLGCNICTNLKPPSAELENKKGAFRWAPFFADQKRPLVILSHYSNQKKYQRKANVKVTFYRKQDQKVITQEVSLKPNSSLILRLNEKLARFYEKSIGWVTFQSQNPNIHSFYFTINENHIGGDHGF